MTKTWKPNPVHIWESQSRSNLSSDWRRKPDHLKEKLTDAVVVGRGEGGCTQESERNNPSPAFIPPIELLCIRVTVVLVPQSVKQLIFSVGKQQPIREVKRSRVMTLNCDWPQWIWCAGVLGMDGTTQAKM